MPGAGIEHGVLERVLATQGRELPPAVAQFFLGLNLGKEDDERIRVLSEKANEGDLNPQERDELAMYVMLGDFLAIVQSRAALTKQNPAA